MVYLRLSANFKLLFLLATLFTTVIAFRDLRAISKYGLSIRMDNRPEEPYEVRPNNRLNAPKFSNLDKEYGNSIGEF